jgi:hypothetical protein
MSVVLSCAGAGRRCVAGDAIAPRRGRHRHGPPGLAPGGVGTIPTLRAGSSMPDGLRRRCRSSRHPAALGPET